MNGKVGTTNLVMPQEQAELYRRMYLIRRVDEEIRARYTNGLMRCPVHLSIGQELPAAALSMALRPGDKVFASHRSHSYYLAMGGDLRRMVAELHGLPSGCCQGRGGSMHLVDESVGFMGTVPIVGSCLPIALGYARAMQIKGAPTITVAIVGDAGPETGQFWETINMMALWRPGLVVIVENNRYATSTPLFQRQPPRRITDRLVQWPMVETLFAGTSMQDVYSALEGFQDRAPAVIEVLTYRLCGHVGMGDDSEIEYRSSEELDEAWSHDPLIWVGLMTPTAPTIRAEIDRFVLSTFDAVEQEAGASVDLRGILA